MFKAFDAWQFPKCEQHLQMWMSSVNDRRHGRLTYQAHKYDAAIKYCTSKRVAVDIGAHVGLWSFLMAHDFEAVHAFEPHKVHAACWRQNIPSSNCTLHPVALGAEDGFCTMETRTPDSSGDTGVAEGDDVRMTSLDSMHVMGVDFIKIDCEGYEANVLLGATDTIKRCKPVVLVEQKGDMSQAYGIPKLEACRILESLGMVRKKEISGDYIYAWA